MIYLFYTFLSVRYNATFINYNAIEISLFLNKVIICTSIILTS